MLHVRDANGKSRTRARSPGIGQGVSALIGSPLDNLKKLKAKPLSSAGGEMTSYTSDFTIATQSKAV
jgi:hypothetical protein